MRAPYCLLSAGLLLAGCGYVGDTLPPALNIPVRITDLRAVQRSDKLIILFTPSYKTTEALLLPGLGSIELRCGPVPAGGWDWTRWQQSARQIPVSDIKEETTTITVPSAEWQGKEVVIAAREISPKGKLGDWSNLVTLNVVPALAKPDGWTVSNAPVGVKLTAPQNRVSGASWRILRQGPADAESKLLASTKDAEYVDATAALGSKYIYIVQTIVPGSSVESESEFSDPKEFTPADVFPPAPPKGLNVIAGVGSLELTWERNTEADLASYLVYRAADGEFQKIGEAAIAPGYSDRNVEAGKKYRYRITARDRAGNESQPSDIVEIIVP